MPLLFFGRGLFGFGFCFGFGRLRIAVFACFGGLGGVQGVVLLFDLFVAPAREQVLHRLGNVRARGQGKVVQTIVCAQRAAELAGDLFRRFGHKGLQQGRGDLYARRQVVQHGRKPALFRLVFGEHPGRRLVDILVAAAQEREDLPQRVRNFEFVHLRRHFLV